MSSLREVGKSSISQVLSVTGVETAVITSDPISTRSVDEPVTVKALIGATPGLGVAGVTLRIRRGPDTTGHISVTEALTNVTAGKLQDMSVQVTEAPGDVADLVYTLTTQQVSATVSMTIDLSAIDVTMG